jgi:DNA-binding LytR/AlgR family response regulator
LDATAVIAEDEPLLAEDLERELKVAWPALRVVGRAEHGAAAVELALRRQPDVLFLDIRMPGLNGFEVAEAIAEDWPDGVSAPLVVFVTAYDQHALEAFEHAAVDYVLKPFDLPRLERTAARLQVVLRERRGAGAAPWEAALAQWRSLLAAGAPRAAPAAAASAPLTVIQAVTGNAIHLVPVRDVVYFEAADKYVRVLTADAEHLIRLPLRELLPRLDPEIFWQIHRGIVVRVDAIAHAERDETGKVTLLLRDRPERLGVSRLHADRFKPM